MQMKKKLSSYITVPITTKLHCIQVTFIQPNQFSRMLHFYNPDKGFLSFSGGIELEY